MELLGDDEYHDMQDRQDGTGRWNRKGTPHDKRWWNQQAHRLSSRTFTSIFRIRRTTFRSLVRALYGATDLFKADGRGPIIDPCERVAVFLFRVGGAQGVMEAAVRFDITEENVASWTLAVAKLVAKRLRARYVRWPAPDEQREIMEAWEHDNTLRKVIGAIEGSHIRLISSDDDDDDVPYAYQNFKKYKSIVLLGVVDNSGRFRWFCSGAPGSCTDSGVLQSTKFYRLAREDHAKPSGEGKVFADGSCILGDKAFAEMPWMRTPITLPKTRADEYFNHKHADMRVRVEGAFGRLKWQFQALKQGLDFKLDDAPTIIDACLVLYNFALKHEGFQFSRAQHVDDAQTRNGTGRARGAETSSEREDEVAYLEDAGFVQEEWGKPGSRADRRRGGRED